MVQSKQSRYSARKFEDKASVDIPNIKNQSRRDSCKRDLALFLKTYMPNSFSRPYSTDQLQAIKRIEKAILDSGTFAEAMPRGTGKTTTVEGATIWGTLYGHRRYTVVIGSGQKQADEILRDIKTELESNSMLLADFPHVCAPIEALEGRAQRCASQTVNGERTHIVWRTDKLVMPTVEDSLCSGYVIQSKGITSGVRGLKHKCMSGDLRPDFVILDDPQTRESAESVVQTETRESIVFGDVMGLAGHDKKISAVMPCTVIKKGDLADHFLDREMRPEWQGHRTKLVYSWSTSEELWDEYKELWRDGQRKGEGTDSATAFYKENQVAMDAGCVVASEHMYDHDTELSAIQHAYNLLYSVGEEAFMAEYQNDPVDSAASLYDLSPDIVMSRINGTPKNVVPDNAEILIAFADINHYALTWAVVAFAQDMTGTVVNYGQHPGRGVLVEKNVNELQRNQAIFKGLKELTATIADMRFVRGGKAVIPNAFLIDRGYAPDAVNSFIKSARLPFPCIATRGYASNKYQPYGRNLIGKAREECHLAKSEKGQFIAFNADFWREVMQKAWLPDAGANGGLTLFGNDQLKHRDIAEEICGEYLLEKVIGDRYTLYKWGHKPGCKWDYGDAVYGCYVGAAWFGLSPTGNRRVIKKKVQRRKAITMGRI